MDLFFKLGDKATGGDPKRKMDFDYYLMWIMFLAFLIISVGNFRQFFTNGYRWANFGWGIFGLCICWFQYWSLGNIRKMRAYQKEITIEEIDEDADEEAGSVDDMLKSFKNNCKEEK